MDIYGVFMNTPRYSFPIMCFLIFDVLVQVEEELIRRFSIFSGARFFPRRFVFVGGLIPPTYTFLGGKGARGNRENHSERFSDLLWV